MGGTCVLLVLLKYGDKTCCAAVEQSVKNGKGCVVKKRLRGFCKDILWQETHELLVASFFSPIYCLGR